MQYAIIQRKKCRDIGINPDARKSVGDSVVVTDKEILFSSAEGDTLQDKVQNLEVTLMSYDEVMTKIKEGGDV